MIASRALYEVRQETAREMAEKGGAVGWHTSVDPFRSLDSPAGSSMDREPSNEEKAEVEPFLVPWSGQSLVPDRAKEEMRISTGPRQISSPGRITDAEKACKLRVLAARMSSWSQ